MGQGTDAKNVLSYLGQGAQNCQRVRWSEREVCAFLKPVAGWEQEFFVVPADLFKQRPDLVNTGRTLIGKLPPRNQQVGAGG